MFQNVFYSRKNYKRPELQMSPHQTFEEEVALLHSLFPGNYDFSSVAFGFSRGKKERKSTSLAERSSNDQDRLGDFVTWPHFGITDGEAYCLGSPETDCWYLYTLFRDKTLQEPPEPDQTLEVLMTHLDPEIMSIFTKDVCSSADEATVKSGIDKLIPDMIIDDFLFEPCGYSMNGVSKNVS